MNKIDYYPRPWRVTTTARALKTGGGRNYHVRAASDHYVVENVHGGAAIAELIVESVNQYELVRQENHALTREIAGLRYYVAQLERYVSAEEREYAVNIARMAVAQLETPAA